MCTAVTQQNHSMTSFISLIVFESTAEVPPFKSSEQSFPLESVRQLIHDMSWYSFALAMNCKQCVTAANADWYAMLHCWNTVLSWSGGTFDCPVECF